MYRERRYTHQRVIRRSNDDSSEAGTVAIPLHPVQPGYCRFGGGHGRVCSLNEWHDAAAPSVPVLAPSIGPASARNRRASLERRATGGLGAPLLCHGPGFPCAGVASGDGAAPPPAPLVLPTTSSPTISTAPLVVVARVPAPSRRTTEGTPAASSHVSVGEEDDGGLPQLATWKRRPQAARSNNGNVANTGRSGFMSWTTCVPECVLCARLASVTNSSSSLSSMLMHMPTMGLHGSGFILESGSGEPCVAG